ncbi:NADH-quinone oxidoreductase subunit L [Desulfuribacillus stibiiarsenatis]|uniref:NADH-quinone oxidoreductase subunit L n=1 Tax=Desulfuribacillus stibiiarsenatis TaxID=1390249 RepID=A0A1E5L5P8_9FIRM|nr:NADH-quinone oxidoreductase subunit L [Desulfuribacillus stibiiarsenatis]OEH85450.1 NADH-quinone oxidoreductase subunit L [Desulfuribacillus stibiiarsenatis]
MIQYAWLIPVFPLLAFVLLLLFGRSLKENAAYVGIIALLASFGLSVLVLFERTGGENYRQVINWLTFGDTTITMGFEVTALNAMMLFIVTLVSLLVHMFSRDYLHGDDRYPVFFSYLGLFTFSMLGLVLAPNILQLFIFWELVGLCSYLLVGFWFFKPEAAAAAKKAFLTTRIGDVGLFVGLILTFIYTGSFEYDTIFTAIREGVVEQTTITIIALLIFLGAVGKSAQFPLHVWLPDAMEGPTPVSALIHAATMVAAGVYLVAVMYPMFMASSTAMTVVAYTGAITAIFAASIGLVQNDIKRVLAYSTVSQLGFMILALGTAGYVAGLFHLMTHAFFKALLFLGAGSVIHGVHSQDINEMGGLWSKMKVTAVTFLIGSLAIAGIPPLAGFWSKDEIFASVWQSGDRVLFVITITTAAMTAFYMFRLFFMTFAGKYRGKHEPHESGPFMLIPLIVLSVFAIGAGFVNSPFMHHALGDYLIYGTYIGEQALASGWMMILSVILGIAGIFLAWLIYAKGAISRDTIPNMFPRLYRLLYDKYYIDEIYANAIVKPIVSFGKGLWAFDRTIVDGIVNGVAGATQRTGKFFSLRHNGQVQTYGMVTIIGGIAIFAIAFLLRGYLG